MQKLLILASIGYIIQATTKNYLLPNHINPFQKYLCHKTFNSLPNDKILDLFKFTAFAVDKIILTQKLKFVLGRVENIVGKGENAGYQHFLLFPQCFQKASFSGSFKAGIVW